MMKRLFLLLTACSFVFGQDFDGARIYVNPGHGGHDSNDRYISLTGFWESESNLTKGLYLRDLLQSLNATVKISRTQNRTVDDKALSDIGAEANGFNADYFHSIHSNGLNGNTSANYPLMLFRGYDDGPVYPESKQMGSIMFNEMNKARRQWTYWPYTWENNRGDWDFYNWGYQVGLGVLSRLLMPGTLSEGSFHDYFPNSWRLQSVDYRKHESIVILRSFIKFYDLDPLPHGVIAGLVRADNQQVTYSYEYNSGLPNDRKRAVNGAKIILQPGNKIYYTDDMNNGFYMFDSLAPGSYSVIIDAGEFITDTLSIDVVANETVFANSYLQEDPDKAPQVYTHTPESDASNIGTYSDIDIMFSRAMDKESIVNAFSISPAVTGTFTWYNDDQLARFRPEDAYRPATVYTVTLSADLKSSFGINLQEPYSFEFTTAASHVYPKVSSRYPSASTDSVFTHSEISINFDAAMRTQDCEDAFSIEPPAAGRFEWENENKRMIFLPNHPLQAETSYTVTLSTEAKNSYGVPIQDELVFSFQTRKLNRLNITNTFPANGAVEVSKSLWFYLYFDESIDDATVSTDNFEIMDSWGETTPIRKLKTTALADGSRIVFKPKTELIRMRDYTLSIFPGISNPAGFMVQDTVRIQFKTTVDNFDAGSIIENFENIDEWTNPVDHELTVGVDSVETTFTKNSSFEKNGSYAGRLTYAFSGSEDGAIYLANTTKPSIGSDLMAEFGVWVFGDFSKNKLELQFEDTSGALYPVVIDSIDWFGYKMIHFPQSTIGGSGELYFNGIVIQQNLSALSSGSIYFDDVQNDVTVGIKEESFESAIITQYQLDQNFPNPFNPETTIRYHLPQQSQVQVSLFNMLGQEIYTITNTAKAAGSHTLTIKADDMASGIYFYRLTAQGSDGTTFSQMRKMILMK